MDNEILTMKQVLDLLQIGETTLRELMRDEKHPIPHFYLSTRIPRFRKKEVEKWIAEKEV